MYCLQVSAPSEVRIGDSDLHPAAWGYAAGRLAARANKLHAQMFLSLCLVEDAAWLLDS
jgi:hypothetical protein